MTYNIIQHEIRNRVGLSMLDYCLLESIYNLSTSGKEQYNSWCNASKSTFEYLASSRTITTRLKYLESIGYLEFKDEKRFLKRTTKKYYKDVYIYIKRGEEVAPLGVKKLHGGGEEVAPNKDIDNNNKEEDSFDKRINLNLPFDVVTSSQTIKAIFEDTTLAIQRVKEIYQIEATDQDVKTAMHTFSTVAVASYDPYKGIRTVEKLTNKFLEWIPKSITYESKPKRTNGKDESTDLETYILQHYRPVDLKHMKNDGRFDRWNKQLQESKFKLSNIAKTKTNKNYTTMFLFDCCYMTLGNKLGGSNEQRRIESLNRWEKSLSDYNRNQGDLRNLLKARPQC
jgi:hypothetical protein